ncbi:MAG: nucleotidyltransferase family protein, partial [Oscillospiraceae bacterium]|nr:nucleotidyltransferase family protein [Oscillospiraceae bacterium]
LIERALAAVPVEKLTAVCVVTQYDKAETLAKRFGFRCLRNDRPQDGLSRTVRLGTEALERECGAILYMVADQPLLLRASVARLLDFYAAHPEHIVGAAHDGKRGNPCVFPRKYFPELRALTGDVGGSAVIRAHEDDLRLFEVSEEELTDVDTREALEKLKG